MNPKRSSRKPLLRRSRAALAAFIETEGSGGIVLLAAAGAAMVWANLFGTYDEFWDRSLQIGSVTKDLRHWVNDGLMTVFFFVVGLEIKRELVVGELRDRRVAVLPVAAAIGGMAIPALIYLAFNPAGAAARGWAIPMATDIAFVVAALSILGRRVPDGLKLFVLALAIIDDVGAIVVIAVVYPSNFNMRWFLASLGCIGFILLVAARRTPASYVGYALGGFALWLCALWMGIHPTIAGVVLGLLTSTRPIDDRSPLDGIQARLHPVSSYAIVPLFGLANAGIALSSDVIAAAVRSPIVWGIAAGLVGGKTIGIFVATKLVEVTRIGRRPAGVSRRHIAGGAALSGIGFTVSLFMTDLAFDDPALVRLARLGVLLGSICSAAAGVALLSFARKR